MSLYSLKNSLAFILWIPLLLLGQETESYKAFGVIPNPIEKRLYFNLKNSVDPNEKIKSLTLLRVSISYMEIQILLYFMATI